MDRRRVILTPEAEQPDGPYCSQAIEAGGLLFVSGQLGVDRETGVIGDEGAVEQTEKVLDHLTQILVEAGCSWSDVLQVTVYLVSFEEAWADVERVLARRILPPAPSLTAVGVTALAKGGMVEIELIALASVGSDLR